VKTSVYRVAQEALNNVQKHASATIVSIAVRQAPGEISVEVRDNGRGFPAKGVEQDAYEGLGLLGMRERATMLGGTLAFTSAPGGGTAVLLRIPLAPTAPSKTFQEAHA
jgi:signal transduction histidine kinase